MNSPAPLILVKTEDMPPGQKNEPLSQVGEHDLEELANPASPLDEIERQDALEVVFDNNGIWRRKSSMVPSEHENTRKTMAQRPKAGRRPTGCIVHTHLEEPNSEDEKDISPSCAGLMAENPVDKQTDGDSSPERTGSRHLTKKQLSDMAIGIRELSKKLSHLQVKLKVKSVFILAKANDEEVKHNTRQITEWLLKGETKTVEHVVYVEETLKDDETFDAAGLIKQDSSYKDRIKYWNTNMCREKPHTFDIVLALGGDGTVLYASWLFQKVVPPVLSFALGSLGFLTKFDFNQYQKTLTDAFQEGITVSLRLRFEGTVMRTQDRDDKKKSRDIVDELIGEESDDHHTHKPEATHNILNEVVIDRGPNATMSTLEVFGDNEHYTTVQADGVCIATPTGSTAYNLAAGGSLCHPDNPVILLTAICAHTLSFRPIILPDTMVLRIGVPYDARTSSWASFDGKERVELKPGDYVTISASRFPFPTVLPSRRRREDWIDSISRTLNWNSRERQKAWNGTNQKDEGGDDGKN